MVSVCAHKCVGFVGRQQWQLVEEWLSARPRLEQVHRMNFKVECPERYLYDVTGVAWRNPDDVTTGPKWANRLGLDWTLD